MTVYSCDKYKHNFKFQSIFKSYMKQNKQFSKHVKQVCNKKYKTLNYRIKKGK